MDAAGSSGASNLKPTSPPASSPWRRRSLPRTQRQSAGACPSPTVTVKVASASKSGRSGRASFRRPLIHTPAPRRHEAQAEAAAAVGRAAHRGPALPPQRRTVVAVSGPNVRQLAGLSGRSGRHPPHSGRDSAAETATATCLSVDRQRSGDGDVCCSLQRRSGGGLLAVRLARRRGVSLRTSKTFPCYARSGGVRVFVFVRDVT